MPINSILSKDLKERYGTEIGFIRNCAKTNQIKISEHCYKAMGKRGIRVKDVYESIEKGVIMEIQNFERDTKILFQDSTNLPPNFFVAVAVKQNMGLCVTAYLPNKNKWILGSDNQWRRK